MPRNCEYHCTVMIPLNAASTLEISTSVAHALRIISGETILPVEGSAVIGLDGELLTKKDLLRLLDGER